MIEIVLGVTGSIGAYKAADLVRRLREQDCAVTCVMTKEAREFIAPLTLEVLSERPVYTDLFSGRDPHVVHTRLADQAKLVLIAPATATARNPTWNPASSTLFVPMAYMLKALPAVKTAAML